MIIAIPTSQRAKMCLNVVKNLPQHQIFVYVNNCEYSDYENLEWPDNVFLFDFTHISGEPKYCHNITFRKMISSLPDKDVLFLEDDIEISEDFKSNAFNEIFEICRFYLNSSGFAVSPIWIPEKKCLYTPNVKKNFDINFKAKNESYKIDYIHYIDGMFAVNSLVLKEMKKLVKKVNFPVLESTSGIGPVLSRFMFSNNYPMLVVKPSLIGHGDHESLQFGEKRKEVPLIANISN